MGKQAQFITESVMYRSDTNYAKNYDCRWLPNDFILRSKVALSRSACTNESANGDCKTKLHVHTAASSGRRAPLAILCFPALSFAVRWASDAFTDPSLVTSKALHSSSVAGWPSNSEKNLCRKTVLICSKAWVVYHPSLSCPDRRIK